MLSQFYWKCNFGALFCFWSATVLQCLLGTLSPTVQPALPYTWSPLFSQFYLVIDLHCSASITLYLISTVQPVLPCTCSPLFSQYYLRLDLHCSASFTLYFISHCIQKQGLTLYLISHCSASFLAWSASSFNSSISSFISSPAAAAA